MSEQITTDELLDAAEERTGLLRRQLLMVVAKSAAVRHVATQAKGGELFVLKGGTLLTHVYKSPRQSIADADYLHLDPDNVKTDELENALRFREGGFTMDPELRFDDRTQSFTGKGLFAFDDIRITRHRDRELKITVSVRPGERMDTPTSQLVRRFTSPERLKTLLHDGWARLSGDEIFFLPAEQNEAAVQRLLEPANVERLALEFWAPALARL